MIEKKRIGITGANGLIGSYLCDKLSGNDNELTLFVRNAFDSTHKLSLWQPYVGEIDPSAVDGLDLIIHLAGTNLASGRWTEKFKRELVESRVQSTELLCKTIARVDRKPELLISMSAVGFYGFHTPEKVIDESAPAGEGFLAELCRQWEAATESAENAGVRTIHLRTGIVLSRQGGVMDKMLPLFKTGLGGKLGDGEQIWPWVALAEIDSIIDFLFNEKSLSGPVNNCSPNPVSNAEFTETLGNVLGRPTLISVPAFAIKAAMGSEMAGETALKGARVVPRKLLDAGYQFRYPDLAGALKAVLD